MILAVSLSEQNLDGRKLLIKASSDFTGRPASAPLPVLDPSSLVHPSSLATATNLGADGQVLNRQAKRILDKQKNGPGPTLFIGNLGFETTVEDLKTMFDAHQRAAGAIVPVGEGEDESKGEVDEDREDDSDDSETEALPVERPAEQEAAVDEDVDISTLPVPAKLKRERQPKREKGAPIDLTKAKDAGIRKIRLGTFEDTGKCKGYVDASWSGRNFR